MTVLKVTTINSGTFTISKTLSDNTAVIVASGAIYDVDASDTITQLEEQVILKSLQFTPNLNYWW